MSFSKLCSLVIVLNVLVNIGHSFNVNAFCKDRCMRGSGGVLCQCNAFHFAGKRAHVSPGQNSGLSLSDKPKLSAGPPNGKETFGGDAEISRFINKLTTYMIEYRDNIGDFDPDSRGMRTMDPTVPTLRRVNSEHLPNNPSSELHNNARRYPDSYLFNAPITDDYQENDDGDDITKDHADDFEESSRPVYRRPWRSLETTQRILSKVRKARTRLHEQAGHALKLLPFLVMDSRDTKDAERVLESLDDPLMYFEPTPLFSTPVPTPVQPDEEGELSSRVAEHLSELQNVLSRAIRKRLMSLQRSTRSVASKDAQKVNVNT